MGPASPSNVAATHFNVMVVSSRNSLAISTFTESPFRLVSRHRLGYARIRCGLALRVNVVFLDLLTPGGRSTHVERGKRT
jgi:hypothetical protein